MDTLTRNSYWDENQTALCTLEGCRLKLMTSPPADGLTRGAPGRIGNTNLPWLRIVPSALDVFLISSSSRLPPTSLLSSHFCAGLSLPAYTRALIFVRVESSVFPKWLSWILPAFRDASIASSASRRPLPLPSVRCICLRSTKSMMLANETYLLPLREAITGT